MRKMAAKTENGRNISQEIDDKVQTKNQNTSISSSDDKRRKQKRPTRGIYTPPSILRQKQLEHDDVKSREAIPETENWADEIECHSSTSDSKENSVERELEVDNTRTGFKNLNITEKGQSADRHRSKRPALQIYVPKGKLLEQQTKGSEEEREIEELETDGKSQEFRKVDVKQDQKHLQVTVVNEQSSPKSKSASESLTYQKKGGNPRDANNKERIEDTKQDHKQKHNQQDARGFRAGSHDKFAKGDSGQQYNKDKRSGYTTQGDNRQRNNPNTKHDSGFRKNEPQGQGNRGFNRHSGHGSHRGNQEYIHGPGGAKSGNRSDVKKSPAAVEKVKSPETREAAPEDDEDIDSNIIQTMVFERKGSSSSAVESSDIQNLKQKPPSGQQGGGKPGSKRYSLSAMRRPRAGSVSSDVSTASDLSIDEETTTRILDWDAEVEREMAKQVQDETLKLKEFLERQGDFDDWDRASNTESPFEKYYEYGSKTQDKPDSKDTMDKQYDRSDYERNKERNLNNGLRNKNSNASYSGFQSRKSTSRERLLDDDYNRNFDDRYYEEGPRSRRKDRKRGDSANGRQSRDSSVSSVHSVRSCHDDEMYGGSSTLPRRRRRRRRSSGGSSLRQSSSHDRLNEPDALNLKVTFAQNDHRQVSLQESDRRGRGRGRGQKRHEQGQQRHEQDHGGRGHFYQSHGSQREKLRSSSEQDIRGTGKYLDEQHKHGESRTLDRKYENRRRNMQEQERLYDSFDDHGRGHDRDRGQGQGRGQGRGGRGRGRGQENTRYQRGSQSDMDPAEQALTRSKTQNKMMAERTFQEALPLDKQLGQLISCRMTGEGIHMMSQLRHQLQHKYERIILLDADISNRHNVEQLLWKSVFYQVIEVFRKHVADEKDEETKSQLTQILEEGTAFYNDLLQKLQQTFSFNLEDFIDENKLPPENLGRTVKLALWYSKAQQIAPKNGRPYNQLAILALYTRRKLDAVYYYMRSLAASNPFLTARESLMSLFDEARKKAEAAEKKRDEERMKLSKHKKHRQQHGHRVEIWVSPDGSSQEDQDDGFDPDDLTKLDAIELNKRFVLSFLNVHGKLFTKIGRENFMECCAQMLKEFQALLKDGAIGPTRLLQLMAINMFAIENTALKEESLDDAVRSELQELAVQLGLDMFGILVERCSVFLTEHLQSRDYPSHMFSRDLEELIPGVKIWTDWMTCNSTLWNPPPCLRDITLGPNIDVWKVTAEFCNVLKDLDVSHVKLYQDRREGCDPVVLPEDTMLAGFVPLLSALMESSFVHSTVEKEIAKDCLRIQKLQLFGEYLCGIEPPMLAFNVETKRYYSVAPSIEEEEIKEENYMEEPLSDEDVIIESEEEVLAEGEDGDDEHVRQLKTKKEELKKKKEEQEKLAENKQKILDKNRHRSIELEIHPIFLVPDTNCFIDHSHSLKKLVQINKFTVVVPLIVINELDGLAKGSKHNQNDSPEHVSRVQQKAKEMVEFLEEEFEKKSSHLKALTSKGSMLQLYRDVVLLTDDRNLRLKAHTCNVPVKDVPSFLKWSNIT
ncbi:LOW QUALITY PROTEIN: hypothetical protein KUTeg_010294 [Tegillarca granosa]|uniref:PIN domain-containing protein n=1 Tax=Tegillarca granosa TaxID=220873 RepID=A0ABQ9F6B0_TEGGR|nr:LOW QUALITY PROTEIN: hypothetical protein KUTeg_010294 [Tegillarca granosa]